MVRRLKERGGPIKLSKQDLACRSLQPTIQRTDLQPLKVPYKAQTQALLLQPDVKARIQEAKGHQEENILHFRHQKQLKRSVHDKLNPHPEHTQQPIHQILVQ